ncbi:hypothetical protein [Candidatus Hodgkinia cicadicola]|uniref:hypothetical protein n=1 Tax=Candidatus Hodgkinia cicadicola TaxID=573658 RepID=UPI001788BA80
MFVGSRKEGWMISLVSIISLVSFRRVIVLVREGYVRSMFGSLRYKEVGVGMVSYWCFIDYNYELG